MLVVYYLAIPVPRGYTELWPLRTIGKVGDRLLRLGNGRLRSGVKDRAVLDVVVPLAMVARNLDLRALRNGHTAGIWEERAVLVEMRTTALVAPNLGGGKGLGFGGKDWGVLAVGAGTLVAVEGRQVVTVLDGGLVGKGHVV